MVLTWTGVTEELDCSARNGTGDMNVLVEQEADGVDL